MLETASTLSTPAGGSKRRPGVSLARVIGRVMTRDPGALIGATFIAALFLIALFAPVIAPFDPTAQSIVNAFAPPSWTHWFGTDEYGRDLLSRVIYGTRPALAVGLLSVVLAVAIGVPLGMIAGLRGGYVDLAVVGLVDIMMSFPSLLLALMIVTLVGSGVPVLVLAIGIANVPIFIRLARSSTLLVRELDFVSASRTFGAGNVWVMGHHVMPNIIGPIVVMGTLNIAGAIRDEAALSFLGLGVQPPQASWGNLIREGVNGILTAPWIVLISGFVLALAVLAFNMIGDSIRDILDPRDVTRTTTSSVRTK